MKNVNTNVIVNVVVVVAAVVALLALYVFAPVCSGHLELANGNMAPMRCFFTGKVCALISLIAIIAAVTSVVTKKPATVILVCLGVAMILMTFETPLSIGVCKSADMACVTTALWLRICGGTMAVAALAGAVLNPTRKRAE